MMQEGARRCVGCSRHLGQAARVRTGSTSQSGGGEMEKQQAGINLRLRRHNLNLLSRFILRLVLHVYSLISYFLLSLSPGVLFTPTCCYVTLRYVLITQVAECPVIVVAAQRNQNLTTRAATSFLMRTQKTANCSAARVWERCCALNLFVDVTLISYRLSQMLRFGQWEGSESVGAHPSDGSGN
jgi:hypothetical protein